MSPLRIFCWLGLFAIMGCQTGAQPPKASVAAEKPRSEDDLSRTSISKKAFVALAIKTAAPRIVDTHERLTLTGWIMAKPGNEITLTAPASGYVSVTAERGLPIPGSHVDLGDKLLYIEPVLSPVEQIQVATLKRGIEGEFKKAQASLKNAESEYNLFADLFKQKLRSRQEFELARKARDHAAEELAVAKDKLQLFLPGRVAIQAPQAGMVLQTLVSNGQYVPTASPLLTLIDLNPLWVRVPVPEFDLPRVDLKQDIEITWKNNKPGNGAGKPRFTAKPAGRSPFVDTVKHTADLWYEIDGAKPGQGFVKDLMVSAQIPLGSKEKSTLLPYSAIVFDAHGQAWIYVEKTKAQDQRHVFERRRVEIVTSHGKEVSVHPMLGKDDAVVTAGGALLFSREFFKTPVTVDGEEQ